MQQYEYAQLIEYVTYKGAFLKGTPVMAYFLVLESSEQLLKPLWLMHAMNDMGRAGWMEYRVDVPPPGSPLTMTPERVSQFKERHGWIPSTQALQATRWFRREWAS